MVKTVQIQRTFIKVVILFLVFNVVMFISYPQKIIRSTEARSNYFGYINFKRTQITLPDTILTLSLRDLTAEKFIQGMFFEPKQKLKVFSDSLWYGEIFSSTKFEWMGKQEVPESFVNLLCDNGIVNIARDHRTDYWFTIFQIKGDTIIQHFKDRNEFWFLGKLSINPNFDSYLILTTERNFSDVAPHRSLFLLNVKDNTITSLIQVAYEEIFWGEGPYFFTKASSKGKYCYYGIYYSEYHKINTFGKRKFPKLEKYICYSFDDNGYVQLYELKGRKKFLVHKYKYFPKLQENVR